MALLGLLWEILSYNDFMVAKVLWKAVRTGSA